MLKKLNKEKSLLKAGELASAGNFIEAIEIYKALLESDPNDINVKFLLGILYLQSDQFHSAIKELQDALKRNPNLLNNCKLQKIH